MQIGENRKDFDKSSLFVQEAKADSGTDRERERERGKDEETKC